MKQNENTLIRKIFIISILVLASALCIFMIILNYMNIKNQNRATAELTGNFNSIKDILEYYGCEYIKVKDSSVEGFSVDIYTKFKYDLYDGEESNEDFFNKVINKIAEFLNYESFRMIDESKTENIEIQVICDGKSIKNIIINGIEDYFIYMDSQIDAKKYQANNEIEIQVESAELLSCLQNSWDKSTEFGTREAIFKNYYIYFDEGIETRIISGKIYNIIFTEKYESNVVNGLNPKANNNTIIKELGEPTFKNEDSTIIGYKSKDMYVFFGNNEISIYRNSEENYDDFFQLVDEFLTEKYTFLEFMNELTYIWPDYETYDYSEDTVFLSYPNKGVDIKINYQNVDGIVLYNNIGVSLDVVKKYLENTEFVSNMKIDNIYNAEVRRIERINELEKKCDEYQQENELENDTNYRKVYKYYMDQDSNGNIQAVYFVSQSKDFFNNQLIEGIDDYIWMDDTTFIYSKRKRGIYRFDLTSGTKSVIVTGDDNFEIISYEDGMLNYDESSINI